MLQQQNCTFPYLNEVPELVFGIADGVGAAAGGDGVNAGTGPLTA